MRLTFPHPDDASQMDALRHLTAKERKRLRDVPADKRERTMWNWYEVAYNIYCQELSDYQESIQEYINDEQDGYDFNS